MLFLPSMPGLVQVPFLSINAWLGESADLWPNAVLAVIFVNLAGLEPDQFAPHPFPLDIATAAVWPFWRNTSSPRLDEYAFTARLSADHCWTLCRWWPQSIWQAWSRTRSRS